MLLTTFFVTNTDPDVPGSLAEAISEANVTPGAGDILFEITGTIEPLASLVPR